MLCLDMQFWNKEEGKWGFAGEPVTVLEVCCCLVSSCDLRPATNKGV